MYFITCFKIHCLGTCTFSLASPYLSQPYLDSNLYILCLISSFSYIFPGDENFIKLMELFVIIYQSLYSYLHKCVCTRLPSFHSYKFVGQF
uniref:Uncharacterized protein n=1 Tax=Octopus bimaculoides TaxID=37653 RepID=A0A0L8GU08_OCTBM